jgi:hypothetical protein
MSVAIKDPTKDEASSTGELPTSGTTRAKDDDSPDWFDRVYLATDDPRAQSGFRGSAERWEAARKLIAYPIDRPGTFLDVGCANGLLMECVVRWAVFPVEPYGIDFAPGLVDCAQRRLPEWRERIVLADARSWTPPHKFDFVHVRLDQGDVRDVLSFGRRIIVSSDGSFRRPDSKRCEPVAERLTAMGLDVSGAEYRRSHEERVELCVAWVDVDR